MVEGISEVISDDSGVASDSSGVAADSSKVDIDSADVVTVVFGVVELVVVISGTL